MCYVWELTSETRQVRFQTKRKPKGQKIKAQKTQRQTKIENQKRYKKEKKPFRRYKKTIAKSNDESF